jgi:hypothetical protein
MSYQVGQAMNTEPIAEHLDSVIIRLQELLKPKP